MAAFRAFISFGRKKGDVSKTIKLHLSVRVFWSSIIFNNNKLTHKRCSRNHTFLDCKHFFHFTSRKVNIIKVSISTRFHRCSIRMVVSNEHNHFYGWGCKLFIYGDVRERWEICLLIFWGRFVSLLQRWFEF